MSNRPFSYFSQKVAFFFDFSNFVSIFMRRTRPAQRKSTFSKLQYSLAWENITPKFSKYFFDFFLFSKNDFFLDFFYEKQIGLFLSQSSLSLCGPCVSEWPRRVTVRAPKKVFARTVEKNKKIENVGETCADAV